MSKLNHKFDGGHVYLNNHRLAMMNVDEKRRIVQNDEVTTFAWNPNQRAHEERGHYQRIVASRIPDSISYGKGDKVHYFVEIEGAEYEIVIDFAANTVKIVDEIRDPALVDSFSNHPSTQKFRRYRNARMRRPYRIV